MRLWQTTTSSLRDGCCIVMLQEKWPDLSISLSTIKRARKDDLGWVKSKPKYCQLIRNANKDTGLEWMSGQVYQGAVQRLL